MAETGNPSSVDTSASKSSPSAPSADRPQSSSAASSGNPSNNRGSAERLHQQQQKGAKNNRGGNKKKPPANSNNNDSNVNTTTQPEKGDNNNNNNNKSLNKKNNWNRNRNRPKPKNEEGTQPSANDSNNQQQPGKNRKKNQRQRQNRKKRANNQRYPWRRHIPDESVDPITLEPLHTLPYPPFALFAEEPYTPIEEWPFPEDDDDGGDIIVAQETEEQRQQRILQEQWGDKLAVSLGTSDESDTTPSPSSKDRHVHLYDGRALAYYCVSQLQFIDPLNRRDLTRDEIVNLDRYLKRHGFQSLNVTEAYDAKGVTISTAGAAATTAAGRAAILQQEAAVLLNSLFGGGPTSPNRSPGGGGGPNNQQSLMMAGYQAHEQQQQQQLQRQQRGRQQNAPPHNQQQPATEEEAGIYGDAGGVLVIDDDLNPGLRGNNTNLRGDAQEFVPGSGSAPYTLWSSSHIASQFGHRAETRAAEFPALAPSTKANGEEKASGNKPSSNKKPLPKSNTLSKIAVSVKKTDPEERQRMHEAHERWLKRMEMTNLTFGGGNPVGLDHNAKAPPPTEVSVPSSAAPTDAQLERNRAFASALGVKPSTVRKDDSVGGLSSGWARPTETRGLDEFGNELVAASYSDELILQAKEHLGLLTKLERRWKLFLEDDSAASLPLWPMDRATRTFVHAYSDFWHLNTESFDREPKRYIHCVKLLDTRAPTPLLTDAVRSWKGPSAVVVDIADLPRHSGQTAGETTTQTPPRWQGLETETSTITPPKQRPELKLQKRTLPLELPPFEPPATSKDYFSSEERRLRQERMEEKAQKERAQVEAKRAALEAAFASDDEDEQDHTNNDNDDDSDWTQEEDQYDANTFSDEEEKD